MALWQIVGGITAAIAVPLVLYRLHRWMLRLEERGYIYYWHKKPQSGSLSCFSAVQEIIEPGRQHVIVAQQMRPEDAERRQRALEWLLALLGAESIDRDAIRGLLARYGDGWPALYEEALRAADRLDPNRTATWPTLDEVAPEP